MLELVVAMTIALGLALVMTKLFLSGQRWQSRNLRRTNLQQQMMLAVQRISADLQQSTPLGITVGPNQLALQRIADVSTDIPPRHIWETALIVYFVNSRGLYRRSWPPAPPNLGVTLSTSQPFHPDPTQLNTLCTSGGAIRVGSNLTIMQVSPPNTLPLSLRLSVAEEGETLSSVRILSLRNAE